MNESTKQPDETTEPSASGAENQIENPPASETQTKPATAGKKSRFHPRIVALAGVSAGMILGAIVEMFVQGAMESTGWFGPTLEAVMDEQVANFNAIQEKLEALSATTNETERTSLEKELQALIARQKELTGQTHSELRDQQQQVQNLKTESLASTGSARGADVWLKAGEGITVGNRGNVFSLISVDGYHRARVNLSGTISVLNPGDFVEAPVGSGEAWKVFYKQTSRGDDKTQLGFDVVSPEELGK